MEEMNNWLCRLTLEEEISKIVSTPALDKSLGPDGFTGGFFK